MLAACYGFGGAFAYAKQVAAFAARVTYSNEPLPSVGLAAPLPRRHTPQAPSRVRQMRKHIRPVRHAALRQGFKGP